MAARRHGRVSGRRIGRTWRAGLQLILQRPGSIGETTRVGERGSFVHLQRRSDVSTSARECFVCLRCIARSADVDIGVPTLYLRGVVWGKGTGMNPTFGWTAEDAVQWDRQACSTGTSDTRHVQ